MADITKGAPAMPKKPKKTVQFWDLPFAERLKRADRLAAQVIVSGGVDPETWDAEHGALIHTLVPKPKIGHPEADFWDVLRFADAAYHVGLAVGRRLGRTQL